MSGSGGSSDGVPDTRRVVLAHERTVRLGPLTIAPALRQLVHADGRDEIVEPKVMEVLVVLLRADGGILTRDELCEAAWDGRVVGDDAINRVLSRIRRLSEGIGDGIFRLETITKVGYRLLAATPFEMRRDPPRTPRRPYRGGDRPRPARRGRAAWSRRRGGSGRRLARRLNSPATSRKRHRSAPPGPSMSLSCKVSGPLPPDRKRSQASSVVHRQDIGRRAGDHRRRAVSSGTPPQYLLLVATE